jgi:hypothetical protein
MARKRQEFKAVDAAAAAEPADFQVQSLSSLNILKENTKFRSVPYRTSLSGTAAPKSRHFIK